MSGQAEADTCPACEGRRYNDIPLPARAGDLICKKCNGSGRVKNTVEVTMPQDESELRARYERSLRALYAQTDGGELFIRSVADSLTQAQMALREANRALMEIGKASRVRHSGVS